MQLETAATIVDEFQRGSLTTRIAALEHLFQGVTRRRARSLCLREDLDPALLEAAFKLKTVAGQINVIIHAAGILTALPSLLGTSEKVSSLSLGAGNTGRSFDLETDQRIAEFKFIRWRGGPETIRQNSVFKDFFALAEARTKKERYLYVLGMERPLKFLRGGRQLKSVMSKNAGLASEFEQRYGSRFRVVREYYEYRKNRVQIVDLLPIVPELGELPETD